MNSPAQACVRNKFLKAKVKALGQRVPAFLISQPNGFSRRRCQRTPTHPAGSCRELRGVPAEAGLLDEKPSLGVIGIFILSHRQRGSVCGVRSFEFLCAPSFCTSFTCFSLQVSITFLGAGKGPFTQEGDWPSSVCVAVYTTPPGCPLLVVSLLTLLVFCEAYVFKSCV